MPSLSVRRGDAEEETASQDGQRWQDDSVLFTSAVYVPLAEQIAGSPVRTGSVGGGVPCRAASIADVATPVPLVVPVACRRDYPPDLDHGL